MNSRGCFFNQIEGSNTELFWIEAFENINWCTVELSVSEIWLSLQFAKNNSHVAIFLQIVCRFMHSP